MEKHHSRSSAKRVIPGNDDSFDLSSLMLGKGIAGSSDRPTANPDSMPGKPSREDISRCITIWASLYLDQEKKTDPDDLRFPSRPWMGRNPNGVKRFE